MRPQIAWPRNGVRPYESLWLIANRYLALNRPTQHEFARDFFGSDRWEYTGDVSLIYGTRRMVRNERCLVFDFDRLARALGISNKRLKYAVGTNLRGTVIDHLVEYLRFCPQCLEFMYHTIVFQIVWIEICPLHGQRLLQECRNCGGIIDTHLFKRTFEYPFSCNRCGSTLVPKSAMLDALPVPGTVALRPFLELYQSIAKNEFDVPSNLHAKMTDPESVKVIVALLAPYSKAKLPKMLVPILKRIHQTTILSQVRAGYGSGLDAKTINHKHPIPSSEPFAGRHYSRIFRSYRRYLKNRLNKDRLILHNLCRGVDAMDKAMKNPQAAVNTLAMRIWTDELLDKVNIRKDNLWDHAYRYRWWRRKEFEVTEPFVGLDFSYSERIGRCPRENQWIWEHYYAIELVSLWREAKIVARQMIERDYYGTGPGLLSGACISPCLAVRKQGTNELEFLTWTGKSDEDYRYELDKCVEAWAKARARQREIYENRGRTFERLMERGRAQKTSSSQNTSPVNATEHRSGIVGQAKRADCGNQKE